MSAEKFIAAAKAAPHRVREGEFHSYNCHAAGVHWALIALGATHAKAEAWVEMATRSVCLHCHGKSDLKASLSDTFYGHRFCFDAQPFDPSGGMDMRGEISAGDVLIFGPQLRPTHTMVVVKVTANDLLLRGFNNASTFAEAAYLRAQYDDADRPLSSRNYHDVPLHRIPCVNYLSRAEGLKRLKMLLIVSAMPKEAVIDFKSAIALQRAGSFSSSGAGLQGPPTFDA